MFWNLFIVTALFSGVRLEDGNKTVEYLLPGNVVPWHYDLKLLFDIDQNTNFSYFGLVKILVRCKEGTDNIILHGQGFHLKDENVKVVGEDDSYDVQYVSWEDKLNFISLQLDRKLDSDQNYTVTIPFYGNLKNDLDGVYISSYVDKETGRKENLVTTQFEAISARKGFPCFDEPMYKATFTLTIGHHKNYTAVSNMPIQKTTENDESEDNWIWDEMERNFRKERSDFIWVYFEKSVPMSTYLLAFVVSKFAYVESPKSLSNTLFKIWARKDAIGQTEYASTVGPKVLTNYEKWFNVTFPLPKQDMFAIPDFSAGAMENWGLVTYRETALLYDERESSFTAKERVASVIAHELAHQWFGNLVTMKWWSDLWLNEGFATYVGSLGVEMVEPSWDHHNGEAVANMRSVLQLDALASSHPVSIPIDDPKRISEIFDEISYRKGANLIRMMNMFLGEKVFRKAINSYLVKYSYSNAEQDDLWQELTEASITYGSLTRNVTVKEIMDTWTKQTGYPLITVIRNYNDNSLTVTQKRYLSIGPAARSISSWWVPLNVLCEPEVGLDEKQPIQWLSNAEGTTTEHIFNHASNSNQWVLFNADMIALYRVNYDKPNWDLLIETLNSDNYKNIPVLSRVQLLGDSFELAWSNVIDYKTALELCNYLYRETEYLPLETGLGALAKIENVLIRTPDYGAYQKFARKLITRAYQEAGGLYTMKILNGHDLRSVKLQTLTSRWACRSKVKGCEDNAISLFKKWMSVSNPDENNPVPLDLRYTVYCVAMSRGSVEEWAFLFQRYQNTNVAAARTTAMLGLACTNQIWILQQFLEWTIDDGLEVRRQDSGAVISSIARSPVGFYLVKNFLYTRLEDIYNAFYGQSRRLGNIIKTVVEQYTTQIELDEFLVWREKNAKYLEECKLAVEQAIERANVNINWLKNNKNQVVTLLRQHSA